MIIYLNTHYHPSPDSKFTYWESDVVPTTDAPRLNMRSQSPIVCFRSVIILGGTKEDFERLSKLSDNIQEYFEKNFKDQYVYLRDSFCYYITDRNKLKEIKYEAGNFYISKLDFGHF